MSAELIKRADHGAAVVLTLNRPERRNALSRALVAALSDALDGIAAEAGVRAVVLTGTPPAFCAGMDLKEAAAQGDSHEGQRAAVEDTRAIAHLINQVHTFPRPTIAAVNGPALGGGAGLALACDFVILASDAGIAYPEVRRGLVAAIVMHDLVRQVGDRRARQMLLTGDLVGGHDALAWGLVNEVVPPERCVPRAIEVAGRMQQAGPVALATTKRLLDEASNRPSDLRGAAAISASVRASDEAGEGMLAFVEKRAPHWSTAHAPSYDGRDDGIDSDLPTGPGADNPSIGPTGPG